MFVLPVFLINIISSLVRLRYGLTFGSILNVLMAVAFMVLALCARTFALKVQDRVIRLEMELRLARVLPGEFQPRIGEFTVAKLIGLRFASDAGCARGAGSASAAGKADRPPGNQAPGEKLACGLPARLAGSAD